MEDAAIEPTPKTVELVRMNLATKKWYYGLLIMTIAVLIGGIILKKYNEIIIAVPVILVLLAIIRFDKDFIHVPPLLIFFAVIVMYLSLGSALIRSDNNVLELLSEFMIGILLGSVGIIIAYMALGKMPGFANEKPFLIALESFCFGVAAAAIWNITEFYLEKAMDIPFSILSQEDAIVRLTFITLGSLFVSVMFMANSRYGIFRSMITKFLGENSDIIGIEEEDEKKEIEKLIEGGESYSLEFKSTIRTNLKTGEKDKRMEKAVLKSIVAFMNSDGGDLLVGVADNGEKVGVDVESFDNHDKMGLHITNLLSSQIGDEFIPFIKFKMLEYGQREDGTDRVVVRFRCEPTTTPVFLKDGKEEQFYVRSGPSSVELTGADLIKYIDNRRKKMKRKYIAAKKPQ